MKQDEIRQTDENKQQEQKTELSAVAALLKEVEGRNLDYTSPIEFKLPGGVWYPENQRKVVVKPMIGAQQKRLAMSLRYEYIDDEDNPNYGKNVLDTNSLIQGLHSIINENVSFADPDAPKGDITDNVYIQDYLAIYFLTQFISYGDNYFTLDIMCNNPECKLKNYTVKLGSDLIDVDYAKEETYENRFVTLPVSGLQLELQPLKTNYLDYYLSDNKNSSPLLHSIKSVNGEEFSLEDTERILAQMYLRDTTVLGEAIEGLMDFGLVSHIITTCPECHTENKKRLQLRSRGADGILPFRLNE